MDLQTAIEEYFHEKIDSINYIQEDFLITIRNGTTYRLRRQDNSGGRSLFTYAALIHMSNNRFRNITYPLNTKPFIFEDRMYYIFHNNTGREGSLENLQDVRQCAGLLAQMHKSGEGFTGQKALRIMNDLNQTDDGDERIAEVGRYIRKDLGKLPELYAHRTAELERYKKLANRRNGKFDYEYVAIADYYCEKAASLQQSLTESGYNELVTFYSLKGAICHKEFTAHNVLFGDRPYIVNFDNCSIDLPVLDLANIIKRKMRKDKWSAATAHSIINSYVKQRDLTQADINILKITLEYPQKLWRIVNKYYNSRRTWCEKSCLQKLEEIKNEKNGMEAVVRSL